MELRPNRGTGLTKLGQGAMYLCGGLLLFLLGASLDPFSKYVWFFIGFELTLLAALHLALAISYRGSGLFFDERGWSDRSGFIEYRVEWEDIDSISVADIFLKNRRLMDLISVRPINATEYSATNIDVHLMSLVNIYFWEAKKTKSRRKLSGGMRWARNYCRNYPDYAVHPDRVSMSAPELADFLNQRLKQYRQENPSPDYPFGR